MLQELVINEAPSKNYFESEPITVSKSGDMALQFTFDNKSQPYSIAVLVSVNGTDYSELPEQIIYSSGVFNVSGLIEGEKVKVISPVQCKAYVLR